VPASKPLKIAVTGPPASGKSTVLKIFAEMGFPTFSADAVVHELSRPCQPGYHEVVARLGRRFLRPDGTLDRRALLEAMLEEPEVKGTLEAIFHPLVKERLEDWFRKHEREPLLVAEIPLLYQAGWDDLFDLVIFVNAPQDLLLKRLEERLKEGHLAQRLLASYQVGPAGDLVLDSSRPIEEIRGKLLDFIKDRIPGNLVGL